MSEHAVDLFQKVKSIFNEKELNRKNVFKFVELAMEVVELDKDLSGAQKKALVIATIKVAVNEMIPDTEEYNIVEHYVNYFIDQTIEEIIEINGGKLKINPKKSKFYSCFASCGSFFSKCKCPLRSCGCFKSCFKAQAEATVEVPVVVPVEVPVPATEPTATEPATPAVEESATEPTVEVELEEPASGVKTV